MFVGLLCSLALAQTKPLDVSQQALSAWIDSQEAPRLAEARSSVEAAIREDASDGDAWLHAVRVFGFVALAGDGDLDAAVRATDAAREAVDAGAEPEHVARALHQITPRLTRHAMQTLLAARGAAMDESAAAEAGRWVEQALRIDALAEKLGFGIPTQTSSVLAVASTLALAAGQVDAADEHYRRMRLLGYADVGVARQLARVRLQRDGLDAALAWLEPDVVEQGTLAFVALRADLMLDGGKGRRAVESVEPYLNVDEEEPAAWQLLATTQERAGMGAEARRSFERCLALDAERVPCLWGRARVAYAAGRAIPVIESAGRRERKSSGAPERDALYREAMPYLEAAHERDPAHIEVGAALLAVYTALGEKKKLEALQQ